MYAIKDMARLNIEKRHHKRKLVSIDARIISEGSTYSGIIVNLSEEGMFMLTALSKVTIDFSPDSRLKLIARLPSEETLDIDCSVKWFQKKSYPNGTVFKMGMEVIDPPPEYKDFVKSRR